MRWQATLLALIFIFSMALVSFSAPKQIMRKEYLAYAKETAEFQWKNYDENIKRWSEQINLGNVFGYNPPGNVIHLAYISAWLHKITGEKKYALRARKCLAEYGDFRKYYPDDYWKDVPGYENGLPPINSFFSAPMYIKAFNLLKDSKYLSAKDRETIANNIIISCNHQVRHQEWGAMNRGVLRAEMLHLAAITLPDHPDAKVWAMVARSIIDDCMGTWEIEDATHYNGIYLYSLVSLAEYLDEKDFWNEAVTRYTMQFYTRQLAPHGMIPDYGDAYLGGNWHRFVAVLEKAAAVYKDPEIKYAANRIHETYWKMKAERKSSWLGVLAIDCYRWADDLVVPKEPPQRSELVLDDVIGKKVVFRTGYEPKDTYLMVNYKDEGDAGFMSRAYLRETIPVEEEKMTHGHSDENDIPLLMVDGNILLHDGGYRDYMPSGVYGAYRADYFHNRVVVRKEKLFKGQKEGEFRYATQDNEPVPGQKVYDFVRNSGAYRQAKTELIDFMRTENYDYSRTRATDEKLSYQHDRIVNWVKPLNIFVVFDVVKFLHDDYYTSINFWHTRKILAQGENYFDTQYDSLRSTAYPTDQALLVYFPQGKQAGHMIGADPERRYWQDEFAIHQTLSSWYYTGGLASFVTILIPHDVNADIQKLMDKIELVDVDRSPHAIGIKIKDENKIYYVCSKLDRRIDFRNEDTRPQYNYENGKVNYDAFETDAQQLFVIIDDKTIDYTSIYCTKISYRDVMLFEQMPVAFGLQFDGMEPRSGVAKVRYWTEKKDLKDIFFK